MARYSSSVSLNFEARGKLQFTLYSPSHRKAIHIYLLLFRGHFQGLRGLRLRYRRSCTRMTPCPCDISIFLFGAWQKDTIKKMPLHLVCGGHYASVAPRSRNRIHTSLLLASDLSALSKKRQGKIGVQRIRLSNA